MIELAVCICAENKVPEEHTIDIHDAVTGECRSFTNGISCDCTHFRPNGKVVRCETDT